MPPHTDIDIGPLPLPLPLPHPVLICNICINYCLKVTLNTMNHWPLNTLSLEKKNSFDILHNRNKRVA